MRLLTLVTSRPPGSEAATASAVEGWAACSANEWEDRSARDAESEPATPADPATAAPVLIGVIFARDAWRRATDDEADNEEDAAIDEEAVLVEDAGMPTTVGSG